MQIAYLVNQYPKVSHSFIRREIIALEELGLSIKRYSIRQVPSDSLVDQLDFEEHNKTSIVLTGITSLLRAMVRSSIISPIIFIKAAGTTLVLGLKSKRGVLRHFAYLAEACVLKEQFEKAKIEHVHAHFGTNSATVALLCRLLGGPPYSFTVHGPEEFDDPVGLALMEKMTHCRFVVAISDFGRGQLMRWCPHELWARIKVVRCTVDDSFLPVDEIDMPVGHRLVCVGRLCEQKGQLLLLDALRELDKEGLDFELVFAGDGEMRNAVEKRISEYGLQRKVRITGWISGEQVKEEILAGRIMVLPSFAEGLPVVIMEALALQRPVVCTYVAGMPELVEHGKNGWLVPAGSINDLAAALKKALAASPEQLKQMGRVGAQAVQLRHNAATEAGKLLAYFKEKEDSC